LLKLGETILKMQPRAGNSTCPVPDNDLWTFISVEKAHEKTSNCEVCPVSNTCFSHSSSSYTQKQSSLTNWLVNWFTCSFLHGGGNSIACIYCWWFHWWMLQSVYCCSKLRWFDTPITGVASCSKTCWADHCVEHSYCTSDSCIQQNRFLRLWVPVCFGCCPVYSSDGTRRSCPGSCIPDA